MTTSTSFIVKQKTILYIAYDQGILRREHTLHPPLIRTETELAPLK